jgi:TatD DNase family protein
MTVDTHCHLTFRFEKHEIASVLDRALNAGVRGMLLVGYSPDHYRRTAEILDSYGTGGGTLPALAGTIGIHPHEADNHEPEEVQDFRPELERPDIVAIGETGLDFYRDYSNRTRQENLFRAQLELSSETGYPIIIHSRGAFEETMAILDEHKLADPPGVFHCYGYGPDEIDPVVEKGFFVSFAGNLTYPKADRLRQAALKAPPERILVETDSPFLVPQKAKNRKVRRCEPALVMETFQRLMDIRGWTEEKAVPIVIGNTLSCFTVLKGIESWATLVTGEGD